VWRKRRIGEFFKSNTPFAADFAQRKLVNLAAKTKSRVARQK